MLQVEKRKKFKINNIERNQSCLYLYTDVGSIRIAPQNAVIIRISYTQKDSFSDSPGTGVRSREALTTGHITAMKRKLFYRQSC